VGTVAVLGTIGTVRLGLYDTRLRGRGVTTVATTENAQESISTAIRAVPHGLKHQSVVPSDSAIDNVIGAVDSAVESGADTVILGCTELPFVLRSERARHALSLRSVYVVDPTTLLARALVEFVAPEKLVAGEWFVSSPNA
ncbi:MAG: hypothetical protein HKN13_14050, partial [Rhodothermales bacterium]|nr:hypothetical protein [Rhodothermales bacterium]